MGMIVKRIDMILNKLDQTNRGRFRQMLFWKNWIERRFGNNFDVKINTAAYTIGLSM